MFSFAVPRLSDDQVCVDNRAVVRLADLPPRFEKSSHLSGTERRFGPATAGKNFLLASLIFPSHGEISLTRSIHLHALQKDERRALS